MERKRAENPEIQRMLKKGKGNHLSKDVSLLD